MMPIDDSKVMILDADYDDSMDEAVAEIMQEFPYAWRGKKVLVKPNMLAPHTPEEGVTTHPLLVKSVVRRLKDQGAEVMVGDNPGVGGYGMSEKVARKCGILDAAGDCFINLGRYPVKHPIPSKYCDSVLIARDVLDADFVVNLPKLKTHGLTYITAAIKNTFGYVVGGDKIRVHSCATTPRQFAGLLVDIYRIRPPELNIMDAVIAMEGNGPSNGKLRRLGKVLAGANGVCVDAVAVDLVGQNAAAMPFLQIAGRLGLGETDVSKIPVYGTYEPVADFKLPSTFVPGVAGAVLSRFLSRWVNCVPEVVEDLCQRCGICVDHCPVGAMQMNDDFPEADRDQCIHCYCCQEMCPEGAIKLSGRLINLYRGSMSRR
jgi:uncharacterized protein (DUF362 family)/NAD-dependent dihydropyrimidine dehydrogenase PreA subunit